MRKKKKERKTVLADVNVHLGDAYFDIWKDGSYSKFECCHIIKPPNRSARYEVNTSQMAAVQLLLSHIKCKEEDRKSGLDDLYSNNRIEV